MLLAACGSPDQDRLPDNLASAEGTELPEDNFTPEAETDPAPANEEIDDLGDNAMIIGDDHAPKPAPIATPSFDCDGPLSRVEAQICRDPEVAELDRRLADDYERALSMAGPDERARLANLGRLHLAERNRCASRTCVIQVYQRYRRDIAGLMGLPPS